MVRPSKLTRLERSLLNLPAAGRFDEGTVAALPEAARRYVEFLEGTLGVPFGIVSVGQERDRVIFRQDFKL